MKADIRALLGKTHTNVSRNRGEMRTYDFLQSGQGKYRRSQFSMNRVLGDKYIIANKEDTLNPKP